MRFVRFLKRERRRQASRLDSLKQSFQIGQAGRCSATAWSRRRALKSFIILQRMSRHNTVHTPVVSQASLVQVLLRTCSACPRSRRASTRGTAFHSCSCIQQPDRNTVAYAFDGNQCTLISPRIMTYEPQYNLSLHRIVHLISAQHDGYVLADACNVRVPSTD